MNPALESLGAIPASEFDSRGFARSIPLRGRGKFIRAFAVVDPDDYRWASEVRWYLKKAKHDRIGYAVRSIKIEGTGQTEFLHRAVLGLDRADQREGDHRNRVSLDNRKSNLRAVTHAENGQNKSPHRGASSRFRGVSRKGSTWHAYGCNGAHTVNLGFFTTEREAAEVAARYREQYMPYSEEASA